MLLVDIGNTNIHFGVVENFRITKSFKLNSKAKLNDIKRALNKFPNQAVLICSVVPAVTKFFRKAAIKTKNPLYVAGVDFKIPIKTFYNSRQIGMDRLVGAYAARNLFGSARVIIDFGTAITFDFLSNKGEYLGGFILPGVGSSLRLLSECALLPHRIKIKKEKSFIPQNTRASISRGVAEGFSSMINYMVDKYSKKLCLTRKDKIIITGGDEKLILHSLKFPYKFERFLVFKGLLELSKNFLPKF